MRQQAEAMRQLTEEGLMAVEAVARSHGFSVDAVMTVLDALERGGATQAQFSHPDLGGMGQWSRHGMIMVGDMFNSGLKARVDSLCTDLSNRLQGPGLFKPGRPGATGSHASAWSTSSAANAWWPDGCGTPSSTGSANAMRYAFFPETRRLAILHDGSVELYDTGDHQIHGISSQQHNGAAADFTFWSQHGTVRLHEFKRLEDAAPPAAQPAPRPGTSRSWSSNSSSARPMPLAAAEADVGDEDVLAKIERLHELQTKGVLSETEFTEKKKELLARL